MIGADTCLVVIFASTHDAVTAEKALLGKGIAGRIIPTPVTITSECGLAWRSPLSEKDALGTALEALPHDAVLEMEL